MRKILHKNVSFVLLLTCLTISSGTPTQFFKDMLGSGLHPVISSCTHFLSRPNNFIPQFEFIVITGANSSQAVQTIRYFGHNDTFEYNCLLSKGLRSSPNKLFFKTV